MGVRDGPPGRSRPIARIPGSMPLGSRVANRRRMTEKLAPAPATLPSAPQDGSVLDFGMRGMDGFQVFRHAIAPQLVMSVTRRPDLLVLDYVTPDMDGFRLRFSASSESRGPKGGHAEQCGFRLRS